MTTTVSVPSAVYADGGVIRINPSPIGGTWAYCHSDELGSHCADGSGVLSPSFVGTDVVTNNQTEFYALLMAIESLPDNWQGVICSDSKLTLTRFFSARRRPYSAARPHAPVVILNGVPDGVFVGFKSIPVAWVDRMQAAVWRLGDGCVVQRLDGHPTRAHLLAGVGKRGMPVSEHQVWCDTQCGLVGRAHREAVA